MEILNLLLISSVPVVKVLMITGLGAFLATKKIDILGAEARKHLNKVSFRIPISRFSSRFNFSGYTVDADCAACVCLLNLNASNELEIFSTSIAIMLKCSSMVNALARWFMPVNILFTFLIGICFGWILVKIVNPPVKLKGIVLGCCSAGNLGNLLLIIVPAICREKGSPFGDPSVCERYGLSYASLSMALGAIFLWSIAYNIMRISFENCTIGEPSDGPKSHMRSLYGENQNMVPSNSTKSLLTLDRTSEQPPEMLSKALLQFEDCTDKKDSIVVRLSHSLKMLSCKMQLKRLLTPSTIGVVVGFIIGIVPQFRSSMIGEGAPLHVIQDSAELLRYFE
ncbi:hypothetical protein EJ110_NYTH44122 [Nymphaea thermarum]|nr:hypothetical protein EJ110_NYTH44122 [Nymphaea thermarum]